MEALSTPFEGLFLFQRKYFSDDRGYFTELFKRSAFEELGILDLIHQDNLSFSKRGVLRGLHFQAPPFAQAKLVSVLLGEVLDVVVDLRYSSKTFGKWYAVVLSEDNAMSMYVPAGFAHGFVVRSKDCLFHYKCSAEYSKDSERGLKWDDPSLKIDWDIKNPVVSDKDSALPFFNPRDYINLFP